MHEACFQSISGELGTVRNVGFGPSTLGIVFLLFRKSRQLWLAHERRRARHARRQTCGWMIGSLVLLLESVARISWFRGTARSVGVMHEDVIIHIVSY
jgi:hypothetical protein